MLHHQRDFKYYVDLVFQKAKADLRTEAARGYLGVLWWVIEPVMYMGAFYVVFVHFFHRGDENFVMFLLSGLISWKFFQTTILIGSNSLITNGNLMNQVYLPKIVFPFTTIMVNTLKFLIILVLFVSLLLFETGHASWSWIFLPLIVLTQLILVTSITSFFSAIMPFFPDFRVILENVLLMLFFISGVFFRITSLPDSIQNYLSLNPMAFLISEYRNILIRGTLPNVRGLILVIIFSLLLFGIVLWLFRRFDRIYPKIIY
jgi:lipopolysaccharide transport system permease protein